MPTWGEILVELHQTALESGGVPKYDLVRRRYLADLAAYTGRDTLLYYSDWLAGGSLHSMITIEDMQGLMEVLRGLRGHDVDLLVHSPGGSAEATASMVRYLREKFNGEVRVFVPLAAMSAGTMLALSADRIVMGKHSQLGPIDPQIFAPQLGRYQPARAIITQFEQAKNECKEDPSVLPAWLPILQQYAPALLAECVAAEKLSTGLVSEWLCKYMFRGRTDAEDAAENAAQYFGSFDLHQSHSLGINRAAARGVGIVVDDLESDQVLQDKVLSVHHAALHTFQSPTVKIVENHLGAAFMRMEQRVAVPAVSPN